MPAQGIDVDGQGMMVDDRDVADIHAAGFEYFAEEAELVVGQEGGAGGIDDDGDLASVVAEEFVGFRLEGGIGWDDGFRFCGDGWGWWLYGCGLRCRL